MPTKNRNGRSISEKKYVEFLQKLKPTELRLAQCASTVDAVALFRQAESKKGVEYSIDSNYHLEDVSENYFDAKASFELKVEDASKKTSALRIQCVFEAHFHADDSVDKRLAKRFTDSEFRIVIWPFFRQLVYDLSGRMAIPPLMLPLIPRPS